MPPLVIQDRASDISYLNVSNIISCLNILLIYTIPFYVINFKKFTTDLKIIFIKCIVFIFYYLFLVNYDVNILGGGAINKLFNILFSKEIAKFLLILFSYLSILIILNLFNKEKIILSFILLSNLLYLKINVVFQEYFDPIFLIFLYIFSKNFISKILIKRNVYFIKFYLILFLLSSIIYQYYIV